MLTDLKVQWYLNHRHQWAATSKERQRTLQNLSLLEARMKPNLCSEKLFILCSLWDWNTKLYPWVPVAAWNQCVTRGSPVSHDNCHLDQCTANWTRESPHLKA